MLTVVVKIVPYVSWERKVEIASAMVKRIEQFSFFGLPRKTTF